MQAGHYVPKSVGGLSLYFHEKNVHCQCFRCNINLGGNGAVYSYRILEVYGQEVFDEIHRIRTQETLKYTKEDYIHITEYYKLKVKELEDGETS